MRLPAIKVTAKSGNERFVADGVEPGIRLMDFWRWSASDLVSNATRGVLAEFIVGQAVGNRRAVRDEWDAFDLLTASGIRIEVKSAAYVQSWRQDRLSSIRFSVSETRAWSRQTNQFAKQKRRQADVYVFALLDHKDKRTIDPLDLRQWRFFILPAAALSSLAPTAKSIGLNRLRSLGPVECPFEGVADAVARVHPACSGG